MGKELLAFDSTYVKNENVLFNLSKLSFQKEKVITDNVLKQIKFEERHINRYVEV